ncbi:hypothetical protein D0B54_12005 [Solimonas sp. K1W22B-7]|uniref:hypothetical protein n=1 Tax=Solimonas sp. K1W22B-7 TaxID=2303331 RepID=UPI000E32E702|nr:hypothetical protein [Solimonas sp. K1W22B-7]AXQ29373.1 hypothetical protein D0B54_12005 [Solimonas sp. K1W22B-7]
MRRLLWSILLLAGVAGCQHEPGPRPVDVPATGMQLQLPGSWQLDSSPGSLLFALPVEQGKVVGRSFFLVSSDPMREQPSGRPATLESYVQFKEAQGRAQARDYRVVESRRLQLDGVEVELREVELGGQMETRRSLAGLLVRGQEGLLLVGSAPADDFPRLRRDFEGVIRSLRWNDAVP